MDLNRFRDNWLGARARFERRRDEFVEQFVGPLGDALMLSLLASMTPEQVSMLWQSDPATMDAVIGKLSKGGFK